MRTIRKWFTRWLMFRMAWRVLRPLFLRRKN